MDKFERGLAQLLNGTAEEVDLEECDIGRVEGRVERLCEALTGNTACTELVLYNNELRGRVHLGPLVAALGQSRLQALFLGQNIGLCDDGGAEALAELLAVGGDGGDEVRGLTTLTLRESGLTAEQVGVLVRPLHAAGSRLTKLRLSTVGEV
jgi:hypothetical protein